MSVFTGKVGSVSTGLLTPGRWSVLSTILSDPYFVRGLESTFTFNGITLNDSSSPDRYKVYKVSGLFDADMRDVRDVKSSSHGEISYNSYYSGRTIVLSGKIYAGNIIKLNNMISDLQSAFSTLEETAFSIDFPDEAGVLSYCKKITPLDISSELTSNLPQADFMITLRASDPRFYSGLEQSETISPTTAYFLGRNYDLSYLRDYENVPITSDVVTVNNGGITSSLPEIVLSGYLLNPKIVNYTTGQILQINGSVQENHIWTINLVNRTIVDSIGNSKISALDIENNNLELLPGDNIIGILAEDFESGSSAEIVFSSAWI